MLAKLEQFVRRIVEDEAFRQTAAQDPEGAIALFGLKGPERKGALKLCTQMTGGANIVHPLGFWL